MNQKNPAPENGATGLFPDVEIKDYHASAAVSNSGLTLLAKSPFHYFKRRMDPKRPAEPERKGWLEGNLAHCAILEPAEFSSRYVVEPDDAPKRPDKRQLEAARPSPATIAAINWWQDFADRINGKVVISPAQYEVAWRQAESVRSLPELRGMLDNGRAEQSAYAIDPETGLYLKARPDWDHTANETTSVLMDVKTCSDASADEFQKQVARKRYHVQDAFHTHAYQLATRRKVAAFVFAAVESEYPYAASALMLEDDSRERGRAILRNDLAVLKTCQESGNWPSYNGGAIGQMKLPTWAMGDDS